MEKITRKVILIIVAFLFMFISLLLSIYSLALVERGSLSYLLDLFYGNIGLSVIFFVIFILTAWGIYPFFSEPDYKKTTILNDTDFGKVDITLEALKNLVKGVAIQQKEIEEIRIELETTEEGIIIFLTGKVHPSTVIPEITEELQKVTKGYIEDTTGVNVQEVKILIDDIYEEKDEEPEILDSEESREE